MWAAILLTGSAVCLSLSAWIMWRTEIAARSCTQLEARLLATLGRIDGFEDALANLHRQHRKLAGRVYADEYWNGQRDEQPQLQPAAPLADVCENYIAAQREGPTSKAARCECKYCLTARANRDAFRAAAVPKAARPVTLNGADNG